MKRLVFVVALAALGALAMWQRSSVMAAGEDEKAGPKPVVVTDATFEDTVIKASKPVVVDLWAAWCGPCRAIAPIMDELAREADGRYIVAKLDVDANKKIPQQYEVRAIPTLLFFKDGKLADRMVGLQKKQAIADRLAELAK